MHKDDRIPIIRKVFVGVRSGCGARSRNATCKCSSVDLGSRQRDECPALANEDVPRALVSIEHLPQRLAWPWTSGQPDKLPQAHPHINASSTFRLKYVNSEVRYSSIPLHVMNDAIYYTTDGPKSVGSQSTG